MLTRGEVFSLDRCLPASSGEQTIDLEDGRRMTVAVTESALGPLPQPLYGRHVVQQSDRDSENSPPPFHADPAWCGSKQAPQGRSA